MVKDDCIFFPNGVTTLHKNNTVPVLITLYQIHNVWSLKILTPVYIEITNNSVSSDINSCQLRVAKSVYLPSVLAK